MKPEFLELLNAARDVLEHWEVNNLPDGSKAMMCLATAVGKCSATVEEPITKSEPLHELNVKVTKATVVLMPGTDSVCLELAMPTSFPGTEFPAMATIETKYNYGKTWCETVLGITPEVVGRR